MYETLQLKIGQKWPSRASSVKPSFALASACSPTLSLRDSIFVLLKRNHGKDLKYQRYLKT